jgi:hypothetical protein
MKREYAHFRSPMDIQSIEDRINGTGRSFAYDLAATAAGHQSGFTVDPLAQKLRQVLPGLIAGLARAVERENESKVLKAEQAALRGLPPGEWGRQLDEVNASWLNWINAEGTGAPR